jgi:RND family efflux transporter MFP subunit
VEATGRLEAENNVFVSPQTGGALTKVFVKIGDFVSKGQKIATIDNSILRNSMQEVEIQLETAKTIFERQKNLWDQKIGTEVQYIQAKSAVESLERRINTLKSQDVLNVVLAPISGVVDEVRLKAGEIAAPGVGILRIVNFNELKVVANVPDTYAGTIAKGDMVKIKFPDLQKEISAKLSYVSQTINQVSRTFTVEAKVPMTDKSFKPNLTALVTINDQSTGGAIVIPQNYIQNTEQGSIVYIATTEGNKKIARAKIVKTGLSYDGKIEIKSGLTVGDALITEGYQEIVDGQAINY